MFGVKSQDAAVPGLMRVEWNDDYLLQNSAKKTQPTGSARVAGMLGSMP
jgi:hypothetical protein